MLSQLPTAYHGILRLESREVLAESSVGRFERHSGKKQTKIQMCQIVAPDVSGNEWNFLRFRTGTRC